jgi:hypothetical protein
VDSIEWIEDFGKQYKTNSAAVYRKDPKIAKVGFSVMARWLVGVKRKEANTSLRL